ncbi:hypothetical protein bmyco0003_57730 [Bacillus pseudomycoides]|nr:hypothetical protein bmyco0002_48590 [Bacillus pseudomycoides]EEM07572.1 hypothetical protein bmyco0003_57730 [Bacillus pseudomycoides]KFN11658.1 hypothetical protein DJ94_5335 [Bacillus pseudomycoides]
MVSWSGNHFLVVDHMVLSIRLSILRKEDKQLLFTFSVDVRNS